MNQETIHYKSTSWAVRRWDFFQNGRVVEPRSFCQFWRTVVVWASLKMVLPFLFRPAKPHERKDRYSEETRTREVPKPIRATGRVVWSGLLPIRFVVRNIVGAVETVVAYCKEHAGPSTVAGALLILALAVVVISALGLLSYKFVTETIPWMIAYGADSWLFVALLSGGAVLSVALTAFLLIAFAPSAWRGLCALGRGISSGASFVGDIAVTNKKRICPPMEIDR